MQQFPFDHHLGKGNQRIENMKIAFSQCELKGLHVEPVAREDGRMIAPDHVDRGPAAARARHVDDIIMHQGRRMDHFDYRGEPAGRISGGTEQARSQQKQYGTKSLASARL